MNISAPQWLIPKINEYMRLWNLFYTNIFIFSSDGKSEIHYAFTILQIGKRHLIGFHRENKKYRIYLFFTTLIEWMGRR